jgi:hypothetical protein
MCRSKSASGAFCIFEFGSILCFKLHEEVLLVSQTIALECFFEEGGLGDLEFPLPFFFLGSGSTLRQTEGKLDPLCCPERCG